MKTPTQYTIIKNRKLTNKLNSSYFVLEVSKKATNHKLKEALHLALDPIPFKVSINSLNVPTHKRRLKNKNTHQKLLRKKIMKKAYIRLYNFLPRDYEC